MAKTKNKKIDWTKTWVSVGAGGSGALIYGKGAYLMFFYNLADPSKEFAALAKITRLGAVAHGGGGLAVAFMTGVSSVKDIKGLQSAGLDFELDVGAKIGAFLKSPKLKKIADLLQSATEARKFKGQKVKAAQRRAAVEGAKHYINYVCGNLKPDAKGRMFFMATTPAGTGAGAGIFYEWQAVQPLEGQEWKEAKPQWRFLSEGKKIRLNVRNIPEHNGTDVNIAVYSKATGPDNRLYFQRNSKPSGKMEVSTLGGCVQSFQLTDLTAASSDTIGGINMSNYKLLGTRTHEDNKFVYHPLKNKKIKVKIEAIVDRKVAWSSSEYCDMFTGNDGDFIQARTSWYKS